MIEVIESGIQRSMRRASPARKKAKPSALVPGGCHAVDVAESLKRGAAGLSMRSIGRRVRRRTYLVVDRYTALAVEDACSSCSDVGIEQVDGLPADRSSLRWPPPFFFRMAAMPGAADAVVKAGGSGSLSPVSRGSERSDPASAPGAIRPCHGTVRGAVQNPLDHLRVSALDWPGAVALR